MEAISLQETFANYLCKQLMIYSSYCTKDDIIL